MDGEQIDADARVKELELELAQLRRSEALGDVAAALFEELRCVMAPVSVGNELLAKKLAGRGELALLAQHAADAASFAAKLLRETLDFFQLPAPERHPIAVAVVIAELRGLLQGLLGPTLPLTIDTVDSMSRIDRLGLERVVLNLVCHVRPRAAATGVRLTARRARVDGTQATEARCAPGAYVSIELAAKLLPRPQVAGRHPPSLRTAEWLAHERGWGFFTKQEAEQFTAKVFLPDAT